MILLAVSGATAILFVVAVVIIGGLIWNFVDPDPNDY